MLKLIVWGALIYLIYRAAKSWISGPARQRNPMDRRNPPPVDDVMVKDPVCGVYFPQRQGVVHHYKGRQLEFCSEKCRDRFIAEEENRQ
jgi:YHS domain-containing protein